MCGRYTLTADAESIQLAFNLDRVDGWTPRYNIAPTQQVAVITDRDPRALSAMKWGLVPSWAKDPKIGNRMINARSETAAEKPSFRASFKRRRCLIPADGYFEWTKRGKKKIPIYVQHAERELFAFAGLWESWKRSDGDWLHTCAILTTDANEKLRPIHHRMTVILEPEEYELWLAPRELLPAEWQPLMLGPRPEQVKFHEVSTEVNKPVNDYPALVLPRDSASQHSLL